MTSLEILRTKLEELVKKWQEDERKQNSALQFLWSKNNYIGFPRDYNKDPEGIIQRKKEKTDIFDLKKSFQNTIKFVEYGKRDKNCHAYTCLGISAVSDLLPDKSRALENGEQLFLLLKREGLLKESNEGKVVLWFKGNNLKHSGIKNKKIVVSKWGAGNIYSHKLLEVPLMYGNPQCFELVGSESNLKSFKLKFYKILKYYEEAT